MRNILYDRKGQVGGIFILIILIVTACMAYIAISYVMDEVISFSNAQLSDSSVVVSAQRQTAMKQLDLVWNALPVIVCLIIAIYVIKNALRREEGEI
ncbi:MAG: hypothetical protein DRP18_00325 [Candidatus Aenigmatarchaeota archaeon]|nr:MAG: hypothetical protein DRP18_00325 [Candidatus Aenigmarchaeota archaeon]